MKRTFTMLMALAVLVALALPAGAAKGGKPGPPAPPPAEPFPCVFEEGVLQGWDGSSGIRCQWIVEDRGTVDKPLNFEFRIENLDEVDEADSVRMPYLAVTDVYPYGGDICERQMPRGAFTLPYEFEGFPLPQDGNCTHPNQEPHEDLLPDEFALTVKAKKITPTGGTVQLVLETSIPD